MQTCRHFRNQLPRELADELRDADPAPCTVCDAMPHRKRLLAGSGPNRTQRLAVVSTAPAVAEPHWLNGLLTFLRRQRISPLREG